MVHIGNIIRKRLEELGMSKSEFGRRINTSPQNVNGILKRKSLDTQLLQKITKVLDLDFFQFLQDDEVKLSDGGGDHYNKVRKGGVKAMKEAYEQCLKELEALKKENSYLREINELLKERNRKQV